MTTKFHVWIGTHHENGGRISGCRVTEYAQDRETAKAEAVKTMVRNAKAYNAKHLDSHTAADILWALKPESPDSYKVEKIRKAPTRK